MKPLVWTIIVLFSPYTLSDMLLCSSSLHIYEILVSQNVGSLVYKWEKKIEDSMYNLGGKIH